MFVSERRHKAEIDWLTTEVEMRDNAIAALEKQLIEAERTRHDFIEEVRYVIEAGGHHVGGSDSRRGEHLKIVGYILPYLLSGRRHWIDPEMPDIAGPAIESGKQLAAEYGFVLPDDPECAVKAMLDLALVLFNPAFSLPLERLQNRYPLEQSWRVRGGRRVSSAPSPLGEGGAPYPTTLPIARKALETLLAGEAVKANGHTARYDADDMMTWYTNAYGVDSVLCNGKPTLDVVRRFLEDMAAGKEYGLTPPMRHYYESGG